MEVKDTYRIRDFTFAAWLVENKGFADLGLDNNNWDAGSFQYVCWKVGVPSELAEPCDLASLHKAYEYSEIGRIDSLRKEKAKMAKEIQKSKR